MRKKVTKIFIALAMVCIAFSVKAQNNVWRNIKFYEGVNISWRWHQEPKDQYISELMFENNNSYKVAITFTASFVCTNGYESKEASQTITVMPGGKKYGQGDGLYYYRCNNSMPHAAVAIKI